MATIAEAKRLAQRVFDSPYDITVESHADGSVCASIYAGGDTVSIDAPTRRAALAGLCSALQSLLGDR